MLAYKSFGRLAMVKIIKFRIKNYKSIIDTGDCYVDDHITVLAGKNESGKTSVLEALEDFDTDMEIRKDAYPINAKKAMPEITITFEVPNDIMRDVFDYSSKGEKNSLVSITKDHNNEYTIDNINSIIKSQYNQLDNLSHQFELTFEAVIKYLLKWNFTDINRFTEHLEVINEIMRIRNVVSNNEIKNELLRYAESLKEINEKIDNIDEKINNAYKDILEYIPNFILFQTAENQSIPNEIKMEDLDENEFIEDLSAISDLDVELIQDKSKQREQQDHKTNLNIKLANEYKQFWEQDLANIEVSWTEDNVHFWVIENNFHYPPKLRSKGKQWHIAFYIKVTARAREDVPNILLIDEPGLFLHAKAQRDILKKIEESSESMQIIYSTHSPYLIDPNYLNRVRLVEKTPKKGTIISKIHSKADKETITPVLTAIGEDIALGVRVDIKDSFIVEGISDYYYIKAFETLTDAKEKHNIIPGCGDNLPAVGSILLGWGLTPRYILDTDNDRLITKLKKKLGVDENLIIGVMDEKNKSIEQIFSQNDFISKVLEQDSAYKSTSIKKMIAENGGKVLLAKRFYESVVNEKIKIDELSKETVKNINSLLDKINSSLKRH